MKHLCFPLLFFFLSVHNMMAQDKSVLLTGTVKNQDGMPIPHAQVSVQMLTKSFSSETDEEGKYELNTNEIFDCYHVDVKASGYPQMLGYEICCPHLTDDYRVVRDFILYDAVSYLKNVPATIILPVRPDPSLGMYYRLDSISLNKIYFGREQNPQANLPYVLIPNYDFEIRAEEYNLTVEPGGCEASCTGRFTERPRAQFIGTYNILDTRDCKERENFFLLDTSPDCFPSENGTGVVVGSFHAYFKLRDMAYPEFVYNDDVNAITHVLGTHSGDEPISYDLQGRRLAAPPAKGVYIRDGKKVVR